MLSKVVRDMSENLLRDVATRRRGMSDVGEMFITKNQILTPLVASAIKFDNHKAYYYYANGPKEAEG